MNRRTAVALSLAALGTSAAFVVAASSGARADAAPRVIERDIDLAGVRTLTILAGSGSVHVRPTTARRQTRSANAAAGGSADAGGPAAAGATAHLHAELRGAPEDDANLIRVSRDGDRTTIVLDEGARRAGFFSVFSRSAWTSNTYDILLGADVELTVRTGSGAIAVDSPPRALHARTGSGAIAVTDAPDALDLSASSGAIRVYEPRAAVEARTSSGSIDVRGAAASLDLTASSGSVSAVLRDGWNGDAVRVQTSSGSVRLAVPPGFRGAVSTRTSSGGVTDAAHVVPAAAPVISLRTSSGSVRIVTAGG